jgi:uncharacterized protein
MDQKTFSWKVKALTDQGSFTGWASTYGNADLSGDVVAPGAFSKSIQDQGRGIPLLWQHRSDQPVGLGRLSDQQNGLAIEGNLVMSDPVARRAYEHLKAGTIRGLSIGYEPVKATPRQDGGRTLNEVKLHEVSLVTFPMNEQATVTAVKSLDDVLPLLSSLTALELDEPETVGQLKSIVHEAKRLLPRDPAEQNAELLRELRAIERLFA